MAIILLTARQEPSRTVTELWLQKNTVPYDELLMRPIDHEYFVWKYDALQALQSDGAYDVQLVIDDSEAHCLQMRRLGVPVIHVSNVASQLQ